MSEYRLENIPPDEPQQIRNIVELTLKQLQMRYPGQDKVLRGVHAKAHGCVAGVFRIRPDIPQPFQQGVFAGPEKSFAAMIRFSNAATLVRPDSEQVNGSVAHGSRGMAIKLLGIEGQSLGHVHGALTQDFLMINQPVFAFANVEDYEVLSRVLVENNDNPAPFFKQRGPQPGDAAPTPSQLRALATAGIIQRIRSSGAQGAPAPFQTPPASPVDNSYFSAAPFMLGNDFVMRFRVRPQNPSTAQPDINDKDYLRKALATRLQDKLLGPVVFHFEAQIRAAADIDPDRDIENASVDWPESIPFTPLATLTIPLQTFDTPEQNAACESLVFTPWHGLTAHRPLGGINRLRRSVYEASAMFRCLPKEPPDPYC